MFSFFKKRYDIYTDGSQKGQWGSWAFVVVFKNKIIHEASGKVRNGDSLLMEFQAAIEALKYLQPLKPKSRACIHSDSKILVDSFTDPSNQPERNIDQSQKIASLACNHIISWKWVKAHAGNPYNERCDQLCDIARSSV